MNMENTDKQQSKQFDWLKEHQWQKGQSGNPNGRPKGKTMKEFAREFLSNMSEDARIQYFSGLSPEVVWKMAEGNPANATDITTQGKPIIELAKEIVEKNEITINDSNTSTEPNSEG